MEHILVKLQDYNLYLSLITDINDKVADPNNQNWDDMPFGKLIYVEDEIEDQTNERKTMNSNLL